jgi:protein-tyrosine phosphatase
MALIGKPMPAQAATLSREYGGDPSTHRGRFLTSDMLAEHDLVIAMSREHRSAIARLLPRAAKYAFTLRELARIAEGMNLESEQRRLPNLPSTSSDSSLSAWMTKAVQSRGRFAATPTYDDVIDPYKRDDDTYRKSIEQIAPAVDVLVNSWADRR